MREELSEKAAELTAVQERSREQVASLKARGEQLEQQLAAKTEALAASAKEIDGLKKSFGKLDSEDGVRLFIVCVWMICSFLA